MSDDSIKRLREAPPETPIYHFADEITALLDRLDDLETNGAQAVRWAPSSAHWSNELKRLFGSDAREGVDNLERQLRDMTARLDAAERENERLHEWEACGREWLEKTEWMQGPYMPVRWLGKHRADNLRNEIERLRAENKALRRSQSRRVGYVCEQCGWTLSAEPPKRDAADR